MLEAMQFGILKLLTTTGPNAPFGSISSMVPTVKSPVAFPLVSRKWPVLGLKAEPPNPTRETAPLQPAAGVPWLQNAPEVLVPTEKSRMGPWWQGTSVPPKPTPVPETPDWTVGTEGSGQGAGALSTATFGLSPVPPDAIPPA